MSGECLNPEQVKVARRGAISEFEKFGVYVKVPISRCWQIVGKAPIGTRWVDINKGDKKNPKYR